jgi:hypothetical protein
MSTAGLPWVKAGRSWRRGLRTAFVTDFYPSAEQILDGGTHGETFVFLNTSNVPYHYYGKAGGRLGWAAGSGRQGAAGGTAASSPGCSFPHNSVALHGRECGQWGVV